jgi:hypothetical protein
MRRTLARLVKRSRKRRKLIARCANAKPLSRRAQLGAPPQTPHSPCGRRRPFQPVKGLSRHKRERNRLYRQPTPSHAARIYCTVPLTVFQGNISITPLTKKQRPGHQPLHPALAYSAPVPVQTSGATAFTSFFYQNYSTRCVLPIATPARNWTCAMPIAPKASEPLLARPHAQGVTKAPEAICGKACSSNVANRSFAFTGPTRRYGTGNGRGEVRLKRSRIIAGPQPTNRSIS